MKAYEAVETDRVADPNLPLIVRLDGRAFSTFTRGMSKPFDVQFTNIMDSVTKFLVDKTHANIGYTQSDEITLVYIREREESQPIFGGRLFKITSVLAGMASGKFCMEALSVFPDKTDRMVPSFDCRAFTVPSVAEAANCLVWREMDASRNALQMVAQAHFSPKQLHRKSCDDLEDMLEEIGIKMSDFSGRHRYGVYYTRRSVMVELDAEELARIPEKHRPDGPVLRSRVLTHDIAPLRSAENKVSAAFS